MAKLREGQAVTVPDPDGSGRIAATYLAREEDDARWNASTQTPRDWHWVRYEEGDGEGLTDLYPRSAIVPV
jgi:hypothetical protein